MKILERVFGADREKRVTGWILDLYPGKVGEMIIWIKTKRGKCIRLVDRWNPVIYVSSKCEEELVDLTKSMYPSKSAIKHEFVEKFVRLQDTKRSKVLKITVSDVNRLPHFARKIWRLGQYRKYRLWNVDIPASQRYLYDKDLFPLAYVEATIGEKGISWKLKDSAESVDYDTAPIKTMRLEVEVEKEGKIPSFQDPIAKIRLTLNGRRMVIDSGNEGQKIQKLVEIIEKEDPDIIVTNGGDSFLIPYLARRALENDLLPKLILGREKASLKVTTKKGVVYFSYGRVYYRPPPRRLLGRIHIDLENSYLYTGYGLEGLVEIARTCRIPLYRASRATIGTCMTSLQLYQATKDDILIPWKKREPEAFKSALDLFVADRGGFYFEPKVGIHDNVGEIDFSSMYPMLMMTKNISAETVGCQCCPDSSNRVPELDYNICEKRVGIVPKVLQLMQKKRMYYREKRNEARNPRERRKYDQRQAAYKIILCTCFGYLGYRNARFGKVDAHIAACAFARKTLLDTARLTERMGFEIVHGIVDSLYLKKEGATDRDLVRICKEITEETKLPISYEGRYRWMVFLPSKTHAGVPVLNRFYGVFIDGKIKARGIELRRRDTPEVIRQCQLGMIRELARARNSQEFTERIPMALSVLSRYANKIMDRQVRLADVTFTKQLSKKPESYTHNVHQAIAARQLLEKGVEVTAGQNVKYIIFDASNKRPERRVIAAQLADEKTRYDVGEYLRLLVDAAYTILSPFSLTREKLREQVVFRQKQAVLKGSPA